MIYRESGLLFQFTKLPWRRGDSDDGEQPNRGVERPQSLHTHGGFSRWLVSDSQNTHMWFTSDQLPPRPSRISFVQVCEKPDDLSSRDRNLKRWREALCHDIGRSRATLESESISRYTVDIVWQTLSRGIRESCRFVARALIKGGIVRRDPELEISMHKYFDSLWHGRANWVLSISKSSSFKSWWRLLKLGQWERLLIVGEIQGETTASWVEGACSGYVCRQFNQDTLEESEYSPRNDNRIEC